MEKLKKKIDGCIADLQLAEAAFHEAVTAQNEARSASSAVGTLKSKAQIEAVVDLILERAAELENALAAYKEAFDLEYANAMQKATELSRGLHAKRLETEAVLSDLAKQIEAANAKEKPFVDKVVEENGFHYQYFSYGVQQQARAVRLASQQAVAA